MSIDPTRTRYDLAVTLPDGGQLSLSPALQRLTWTESDREVAVRLQAAVLNQPTPSGYLHQLLALGARLVLSAEWGAGWQTLFLGTVTTSTYQDDGVPTVDIVAFDDLYWLLKSKSHFVFDAGASAQILLETILNEWQIPGGVISGPTAPMPKIDRQGGIADLMTEILGEAFHRSNQEQRFVMRARADGGGTVVDIVPVGGNTPIYHLRASELSALSDSWSIEELVTQVLVLGQTYEGGDEDEPVKAPVRELIEHPDSAIRAFGALREIVSAGQQGSSADAQTAASTLFDERGAPRRTQRFTSPDVPPARRGDAVRVTAGTIDGLFPITGITHDALAGTMQVEIDHSGTPRYKSRRGVVDPEIEGDDQQPAAPQDGVPGQDAPIAA